MDNPVIDDPLKAVLIIPPIEDFYATPHRMVSLGAHIVFRILERGHSKTLLIDGMKFSSGGTTIVLPETLSYLEPFIIAQETGKTSFFTNYRHFGSSFDAIAAKANEFKPRLCFISCFAYCYGTTVIALSSVIKKTIPACTIVAGGAGVTVHPDYFLRNAAIDYTLSGEAEVTIPPFISFLRNNHSSPESVSGLGWKKGEHRYFNSITGFTTDETVEPVILPLPSRGKYKGYSVSLSRGCRFRCTFCANYLTHGRSFRHCSTKRFMELLSSVEPTDRKQSLILSFEDDNLLCDSEFFDAVIAFCRQHLPGTRFIAENGLDYRLLSVEMCNKLIDHGFLQFNFTLGSVSDNSIQGENRETPLGHYDQLLSCASHRNVPVITYLICGLLSDTKKTIAENLKFLMQRKTVIGISLFYPVPGLPGFQNLAFFDQFDSRICCGSSVYSWNSHLPTQTLITAFRLARFINLLKSNQRNSEDDNLISIIRQSKKLHTIVKNKTERNIIEVPLQDSELVKMVLS